MTWWLNPKLWAAIAAAAALTFAGWFLYSAGQDDRQKDFDAYKIAQQESRILAERARSLRAEARQAAIDKEARDGQERIAAVEAERDAARVAGERMRNAYLAAAERARTLSRTPAAGKSEPDPDPIGVFAVLLGRADAREEIVRGYADRLRAAATVCERGWDAGLQPFFKGDSTAGHQAVN